MKEQLLLVWELARKDLGLFLADRRGVLLCFAVPILLASFFGTIFRARSSGELQRLPAVVVVEDDSELSLRVAGALARSEKLDAVRTDRAGALRLLEGRDADVVIVLPAGFGGAVVRAKGMPPEVELLHRPGDGFQSRWGEGILTEVVLKEVARGWLAVAPGVDADRLLSRPFGVSHQPVAGPGGYSVNTYSHSFCGMGLQYLLFWGMDSGLLFLRERRRGIWRRLQAAPVSQATLLGGKALAIAVIALGQLALTFAFGRLAFGVTITGSVVGFVLMACTASVLAAATGLLIAGLGGEEGRARSVAILTILVLSMLGGFWIPSLLFPGWVRDLSWLLPTAWALRGLEGVTWQGMSLTGACQCAGVVLGFSVAFLLLALWGFARTNPSASHHHGA